MSKTIANKIKKIVFAVIGISWTIFTIYMGVDFFMNSEKWVNKILIDTGIEVSDNFTAGDIAFSAEKEGMTVDIHEPIWNGLFNKSTYGFVQVEWTSDKIFTILNRVPVSLFSPDIIDGYITINIEDDSIVWESNSSQVLGIVDRASLAGIVQTYKEDHRRGIIRIDDGVAVRFMIHR